MPGVLNDYINRRIFKLGVNQRRASSNRAPLPVTSNRSPFHVSGLASIHLKIEMSFFDRLNETGLIEIITIEQTLYVHQDKMQDLEKMIRMHHELEINIEGIDIIFNLLGKIATQQRELERLKGRLGLYE